MRGADGLWASGLSGTVGSMCWSWISGLSVTVGPMCCRHSGGSPLPSASAAPLPRLLAWSFGPFSWTSSRRPDISSVWG